MLFRRFHPQQSCSSIIKLCHNNSLSVAPSSSSSLLFITLSTAKRNCSSSTASADDDTPPPAAIQASVINDLSVTVSRQQTALASIAKKVLAQQKQRDEETSELEEMKSEIEDLTSSFEELQARVTKIESQISSIVSSSSSSTNSSTSAPQQRDTSSPSSSKQFNEINSRLSAIESKQAIVKIAHKKQNSNPNNIQAQQNDDNVSTENESFLVTLEPGVDGTPRLSTCQVKVFHPTANAVEIRQLMEGAGPVVSCLRKPGENTNNNRRRDGKKMMSNNNQESSSSSAPCFVVTFPSSMDAVRAVENISGMMIRKVRAIVEPHVYPEQTLNIKTGGGANDDDEANADEAEYHHHRRPRQQYNNNNNAPRHDYHQETNSNNVSSVLPSSSPPTRRRSQAPPLSSPSVFSGRSNSNLNNNTKPRSFQHYDDQQEDSGNIWEAVGKAVYAEKTLEKQPPTVEKRKADMINQVEEEDKNDDNDNDDNDNDDQEVPIDDSQLQDAAEAKDDDASNSKSAFGKAVSASSRSKTKDNNDDYDADISADSF